MHNLQTVTLITSGLLDHFSARAAHKVLSDNTRLSDNTVMSPRACFCQPRKAEVIGLFGVTSKKGALASATEVKQPVEDTVAAHQVCILCPTVVRFSPRTWCSGMLGWHRCPATLRNGWKKMATFQNRSISAVSGSAVVTGEQPSLEGKGFVVKKA